MCVTSQVPMPRRYVHKCTLHTRPTPTVTENLVEVRREHDTQAYAGIMRVIFTSLSHSFQAYAFDPNTPYSSLARATSWKLVLKIVPLCFICREVMSRVEKRRRFRTAHDLSRKSHGNHSVQRFTKRHRERSPPKKGPHEPVRCTETVSSTTQQQPLSRGRTNA